MNDGWDNSGEFKSLPPEKLRDLFDDDAKELFPQSFSLREAGDDTMGGTGSGKKPDFSMGAYFKGRSSYPGVNDDSAMANSHLFDLPEQDTPPDQVSRPKLRSLSYESGSNGKENRKFSSSSTPSSSVHISSRHNSFNLTTEDANASGSSIKSLVDFFNDPDKSPMSSSAIMDHVLNYCKIRHEKGSGTGLSQVSGRKKRHSESFIDIGTRLSEDMRKRESDTYNAFSSALSKKKNTSRCSTPDKIIVSSPSSSFCGSEKYEGSNARRRTGNAVPSSSSSSFVTRVPETSRQPLPLSTPQSQPLSQPQQPPSIQLQLNIPQSNLSQNLPGPLIISIMCPSGDSQTSTVATMMNSRPSAGQDVVLRENNQQTQPAESASRPQIAIQFSGTIQWNQ